MSLVNGKPKPILFESFSRPMVDWWRVEVYMAEFLPGRPTLAMAAEPEPSTAMVRCEQPDISLPNLKGNVHFFSFYIYKFH